MGNSLKRYLPTEMVQNYMEKTFLSEQEIQTLFKVFCDLNKNKNYNPNEVKFAAINEDVFNAEFKQVRFNPFKERIFRVFSSPEGMTFDDLLELMSVFSENAPLDIKVEFAFKIYDFDDDSYLSKSDLYKTVSLMLEDHFDSEDLTIEEIVDNMDIDGKGNGYIATTDVPSAAMSWEYEYNIFEDNYSKYE